jgi:hypothetical protein
LPEFLYQRLSRVLTTEQGTYRNGRLVTDSSIFVAPPVLLHDTLAFIPYPPRAASTGFVQQTSVNRAIQANVERLSRDLRVWVRFSPRDPLAHAMLGEMLEKAGVIVNSAEDSLSAMVQIRAARALTADTLDKLGFSTDLVRLAIKADSFTSAARLADSILSSIAKPTTRQAVPLLRIATVVGDRRRATELLRPLMEFPRFGPLRPDGRSISAPPAVLDLAADATIRASLGICDDSLRDFSSRLGALLTSYISDSSQREMLRSAVSRPILSGAVPCLGPAAVAGLKSNDLLVQQQQRLAKGGRRAFRALFDSIQALRKGWRPGDIAINYTYQESWLLVATGDTAAAVKHLDGTLDALPTLGTRVLDLPFQAGALVRAMALRADLARQRHERANEMKWANAVAALWSHADPALDSLVGRLTRTPLKS